MIHCVLRHCTRNNNNQATVAQNQTGNVNIVLARYYFIHCHANRAFKYLSAFTVSTLTRDWLFDRVRTMKTEHTSIII